MQSSDIPVKFQVPFASGAGPSFISQPLPLMAQPGGRASLTTGFSELNFDPIAAGGIPPWGKDFNGLNYMITAWLRWAAAGGYPVKFDATFSAQVGGYPMGAFLASDTLGHYWVSSAENNTANPNSGGANWIAFPDVLIQQQAGNYCIDAGTPTAYVAALTPVPASLASIVGAPIRVRAANANTSTTPTIHVITQLGESPVPMINSNGTNLGIGQIARANQIFEGFLDGLGFFQVTSPGPGFSVTQSSPFQTGFIYILPRETVPVGLPLIECDGRSLLISSYPALYNVIGTTFGQVDPNHFNIPDLRGGFIRGWDHGRGLDLGAAQRTQQPNGGGSVVGDHVGGWEVSLTNASDMNYRKIIIYGDVDLYVPRPNFPPPTVIPVQWSGVETAQPTYNLPIDQRWQDLTNIVSGVENIVGLGAPGGGAGSPVIGQLAGRVFFAQDFASETRPINMALMFAIAY